MRARLDLSQEGRVIRMSKAILIMEMPSSCEECQLFYNTEGTKMCEAIGRLVECESEKPTWCPLREVPSKEKFPYSYNACIDEILGGGE
jgi:hypothetical protein